MREQEKEDHRVGDKWLGKHSGMALQIITGMVLQTWMETCPTSVGQSLRCSGHPFTVVLAPVSKGSSQGTTWYGPARTLKGKESRPHLSSKAASMTLSLFFSDRIQCRVHAGLQLNILPPQPPKRWNYSCDPPCLAPTTFLESRNIRTDLLKVWHI
jgi:hypothetical protein